MKGKILVYQPTRAEGIALNFLALALRPEWTPKTKDGPPPGAIWWEEITDGTFPHAENFDHCVAALIDYCKAEKQGAKKYTHPRLFPGAEEIWKATVPTSLEKNPRDPCPDHPHDQNNHWNCIGCRSEILAGDRPADKQGVSIAPKGPPVPAPCDEQIAS